MGITEIKLAVKSWIRYQSTKVRCKTSSGWPLTPRQMNRGHKGHDESQRAQGCVPSWFLVVFVSHTRQFISRNDQQKYCSWVQKNLTAKFKLEHYFFMSIALFSCSPFLKKHVDLF